MHGSPVMSAATVARAYRTGDLSPVEVTQGCLDRIAELDGEIKAFATVTAERAIARARAAQVEVRDADPDVRRPLLGIPVGVKDIVDVAGVPTGAGSDALAGRVPATSATVWRRLEDAGAVLIGKTRTHELAYGVTTPPTRNPHDTSRIPGGSSGGSGAALAAGMCLLAVGTDTAGSIRIPAGLCGVVGLKPTRDLCPTDGVVALSPTLDHVGPMGRSPRDVALLLGAMCDTAFAIDAVDPAGLRIGVAHGDALLAPEAVAAFEHAATALAGAGCWLAEVDVPSFDRALWHADRIIAVEAATVHADLMAAAGDLLWPQTRRKLASAAQIDGATYEGARHHMTTVRRGFEEALTSHDVILAPGVACAAPPFGADSVVVGGRTLSPGGALCWNMAAANMAGLPSVALPCGAAGDLPVGVQLIAGAGEDARLLSIAQAVAEHLKSPAQR